MGGGGGKWPIVPPGFVELSVISKRLRIVSYILYIESFIIYSMEENVLKQQQQQQQQQQPRRTLTISPIGFAFITYRRWLCQTVIILRHITEMISRFFFHIKWQ